jgi:hypothetical protein
LLFGDHNGATAATTTAAIATVATAMAAAVATAVATAVAAATAIAAAARAATVMTEGQSLALTAAQQGDSNQSEKHRQTKNNNTVHPRILQKYLQVPVSGKY